MKLQILVLIEKYKKVTDVANELHIKQPTVTFHMKSLEEELGVTLYQIRSGRVWLSEAGKALYPYAQKMTTLYSEAERTLELFKRTGASVLRVGAEDVYSAVLMKGLRDLGTENPELQLEVRFAPEKELITWFEEGSLDAVISERSSADKAGGRFEELFQDELVIICSRQHKWAGEERLSEEEIQQEKLVGYDASSYLTQAALNWAGKRKLSMQIGTVVSSFAAALQAVRLGIGAAFATRTASEGLEELDKEIAVFPVPGTLLERSFTIGLLHHGGEPSAEYIRELSNRLKAKV
ncbi:LysR family transcriptional regulator [Paenibacillus physcomitrellae]|uniref:LysR family transcriptional regulator n=1 Tax=Paenibacillus physcomitrellae TaxID=1619311 RepID=UPI001FD0606A|nr:LysR family transcriptional regulator [Paenibacillus physcomitrellae]